MKFCMEQTGFVGVFGGRAKLASMQPDRCKLIPSLMETDTGGTGVGKQLEGQSVRFFKGQQRYFDVSRA